jgi:gliding motility-associated-like protein
LTLRQGFQQPEFERDTVQPNVPTCGNIIAFDSFEKGEKCGTYYNFEYTGDEKPNQQYLWHFGDDASPQTSTLKNPDKVAYGTTGNKKIILTVYLADAAGNRTCSDIKVRNISVTGTGFSALADITNTCGGANGSITLSPSGGTAPYTYKWGTGKTTPNIADLAKGSYAYTITDAKGCIFSTIENVLGSSSPLEIKAIVLAETGKDKADGSIALSITGNSSLDNIKFNWKDNIADEKSPAATKLTAGKYFVTITDIEYGCSVSRGFTILNLDDPNLTDSLKTLIPNTFSPNGDGMNDDWSSSIFEQFPNLEVQIFNRWGSQVFAKKGFGSGSFDGHNSNGDALPDGAYYYIMNLNDDKKHKFGGAITIVR